MRREINLECNDGDIVDFVGMVNPAHLYHNCNLVKLTNTEAIVCERIAPLNRWSAVQSMRNTNGRVVLA